MCQLDCLTVKFEESNEQEDFLLIEISFLLLHSCYIRFNIQNKYLLFSQLTTQKQNKYEYEYLHVYVKFQVLFVILIFLILSTILRNLSL